MKVSMVDPSLFTGRYDDGLCKGLADAGLQVRLLGRPMRNTDAIAPETYDYEPRFFKRSESLRSKLGEGRAFRLAKAAEYGAACLFGSLRDLKSEDILHFQWLPLAPADRLMLKRLRGAVPLIHTVHNADAYHDDSGMQGRGYRALLDMFDALIVHGDVTKQALTNQGVNARRIHVTAHPPMHLDPASMTDLLAMPKVLPLRILFFGTIRPYKGVDLLIDACIALWQRGLRFELVLAGKPFMDISDLRAKVGDAGFSDNLLLELGFLTEGRLDAHMQNADIIVFPYRHIDSSGAFLSALHHGKAMVTSDAGMFASLPHDVTSQFPVGDVATLTLKLQSLLECPNSRQRLGENAQRHGDLMGNWNEMALATMAIYEEVQGK